MVLNRFLRSGVEDKYLYIAARRHVHKFINHEVLLYT